MDGQGKNHLIYSSRQGGPRLMRAEWVCIRGMDGTRCSDNSPGAMASPDRARAVPDLNGAAHAGF